MPTAQRGVIKPGTDENEIQLDFRKVGERKGGGGGPAARVPAGDYLLEVVSAKNVPVASGKNKGKRQIAWQFSLVDVAAKNDSDKARAGIGDSIYLNTMVEWENPEKQGWFLRNLIEDLMGANVTGSVTGLRLDDKAGKRVGATLVDGEPYTPPATESNPEPETRIRSEIKYTFPAERFVGALGVAEAAPVAPAPKAASNGRATAEEATEAVAEAAEEDEDIEELPVQSL